MFPQECRPINSKESPLCEASLRPSCSPQLHADVTIWGRLHCLRTAVLTAGTPAPPTRPTQFFLFPFLPSCPCFTSPTVANRTKHYLSCCFFFFLKRKHPVQWLMRGFPYILFDFKVGCTTVPHSNWQLLDYKQMCWKFSRCCGLLTSTQSLSWFVVQLDILSLIRAFR